LNPYSYLSFFYPKTQNPKFVTLKPQTPYPKPQSLDSKPQSLNSKYTLNPNPSP